MAHIYQFNGVILARSCTTCGGDGKVEVELRPQVEGEEHFRVYPCGDCDGGGGFHLTEEGADLIEFLDRVNKKRGGK